MEKVVIGLIALVILFVLVLLWLLWERNSSRKTLNAMLEHLDLAIAGAEQTVTYDESMEAAITEKLNQLVAISRMNCENADRDKSLVQSLISDMAHQVRTPLTNIMLYASILSENALSEENKKMVGQIRRQSEKLDFFMKELIRSSYLETEMISVHMEPSEIDKLVAESCQAVEVAALKKKIVLEIPDCGRKGKFDLKWTREALVNILDNAIKYSPAKSLIAINISFYENFFCIQVADQGIGIEESEQGAIFKRFYRSPKVEKEKGLGIGLYLVREIIEKQNGYVKVKSTLGKGSAFSIYLPNDL